MDIDDFLLGKMMIGKREYEVKNCDLRQSDLAFYVDNPRVYSSLRNIDDSVPTQEEIEKHMCDMESVKQLRLSIKENGGLIDPLIVRERDFVVLEGNSRLAAYRLLCKTDPVKWGKVKCTVLPADIDEAAIFTLLGQYHIVGRKDWSPYEQAGYLYRRKKNTKIPISDIARELGIAESQAKNYIRVFEYMITIDDLVQSRWSYYEELLKNKSIQKAIDINPTYEKVIVAQIKTGQIEAAADIRKIGKIASLKTKKGKKIFQEVANGDKDVYLAYSELQNAGSFDKVFEKVTSFRNYIIEPSLKQSIVSSAKKDDIVFCIKKIISRLKDVQKEIENE
ncbi:putative transcriptional regulator [Sphaerochaeta pleomorpha str. Grapes]|uniref:Putative transcriptional regulator n=1 Tax=Sphaerochaeta pleomorpha (strain ATCC BAA-1885 / DSM 22778 / Grapes) TaxID=158190 RepID=G8QTI2_SPHPG|nr:ParB/RepB/Spo0J family partition protein [Sphaerochaeta pleomorpha]AEV30223.1 putative transcriptional regulator [Sphaerochaeta pleomorpha str. Grapes]